MGKVVCFSVMVFLNFLLFFFVQRYIIETKDKTIEECVLAYQYSPVSEERDERPMKRRRRRRRQNDGEGLLDTREAQENIQMVMKTSEVSKAMR